MVFSLNEFLPGTTFKEFCIIIRDKILLHDLYSQYPTENDINELFNIYDLASFYINKIVNKKNFVFNNNYV